jgi:hypothetical protein
MAEEKRLIGNDGSLGTLALGSEVVGNGTLTIAAKTLVQITLKKSTGSAFGGTGTTGLVVGDFYYNPSASAITPPAGDNWKVATFTNMLDINGWNLKLTAAEVDVTTLADGARKYRKGKSDAEGSVSFVWIKGISDAAGGLANQFLAIANIAADGTVTSVAAKSTTPIYLWGFLDNTTVVGEVAEFTVLQVEFFDAALNVKDNEANNQDVKFRLSGSGNPIIYRAING